MTLALSSSCVVGSTPFHLPVDLAGFYAAVVRVFQNDDRASTWLAFALSWLACAAVVMASSCLVFRVSEIRKRFFER